MTRGFNFCTSPPPNPKGAGDFIGAYSMVYSSDNRHYAQAGYGRYNSSLDYTHIWAQYIDSTDPNCPNWICHIDMPVQTYGGDNIQYWNAYHDVTTPHPRMEMWAGDCSFQTCYLIAGTPYDPAAAGADNWPGPWFEQYAGETQNPGNDVPGSSGYKASYTSVAYQPLPWYSSSQYPSYNNVSDYPIKNATPSENYYCFQNTGPSSFNIWTSGTC